MRHDDKAGSAMRAAGTPLPGKGARLLVIEARFYGNIADELGAGALAAAQEAGASIERVSVPGALEIPQALLLAAEAGLIGVPAPRRRFDAAVALGCVIRGETSHYDIVCNNANHWLTELSMRRCIPVGNGILTVDTMPQALERAQGASAGKGGDAVRAALALVELHRTFQA